MRSARPEPSSLAARMAAVVGREPHTPTPFPQLLQSGVVRSRRDTDGNDGKPLAKELDERKLNLDGVLLLVGALFDPDQRRVSKQRLGELGVEGHPPKRGL